MGHPVVSLIKGDYKMKRTHRSEAEKIQMILRIQTLNSNDNINIKKACSTVGISDVTYYSWKRKLSDKLPEVRKTSEDNKSDPAVLRATPPRK